MARGRITLDRRDPSAPAMARRFFFCLRCLSEAICTTRALNVLRQYSYTNHGLHTADFAATGILLLQNFGLGLQLTVPHSELVLLQRQLPRLPRLQPRRPSESYARIFSFGSGPVAFPPSTVKTLVFSGTQDLIRRRHESHKTIMELQSPTRESGNRTWATDGAIAYW